LGGVTLPLISLGVSSNYVQYAADIHDWAGLTAELAFTDIAQRPHFRDNYLFLDGIQLSSLPAPEPGVAGLWSLGLLFLNLPRLFLGGLEDTREGLKRMPICITTLLSIFQGLVFWIMAGQI
jgi:hypothetical protein